MSDNNQFCFSPRSPLSLSLPTPNFTHFSSLLILLTLTAEQRVQTQATMEYAYVRRTREQNQPQNPEIQNPEKNKKRHKIMKIKIIQIVKNKKRQKKEKLRCFNLCFE